MLNAQRTFVVLKAETGTSTQYTSSNLDIITNPLINSSFYSESENKRCMDLKREARNLKRCF